MRRSSGLPFRAPLGGLAAAAAGLYAGVFLILVIARLAYPFELEFIEGGILVQAWRMAHGLPVWLPANAEFVPRSTPSCQPFFSTGLGRHSGHCG